ncbi:MAG: cysteine synthase family protein [Armatimonadetes bacterium]|nr:cysteine synthase family protein [Armatimonadota bacterium]
MSLTKTEEPLSPSRLLDPDSILARIGNTPLLRIRRVLEGVAPGVEVYAKAEWFNPGGSVKDRAALFMVLEGERQGLLSPGKTLLDSTSGNTGIAYAMICAARGYPALIVMPSNVSVERIKMIKAYGAQIEYTDPLQGSDGAIRIAHEIYDSDPDRYFMPDQYNNPANPRAHYETTGPEILRQTEGRVTHFVAGLGTTGTLMGTGRRLKEFNPDIRLHAIQPEASLHGLEGLKYLPSSIVPGIYEEALPDETIWMSTEEAYDMTKRLAREEGLLVGYSSGAAMVGALEVARTLEEGVVVTVFPDGGVRYLSQQVWGDAAEAPSTPRPDRSRALKDRGVA